MNLEHDDLGFCVHLKDSPANTREYCQQSASSMTP